jgi:hypothetical protein
MNIHVRDNLNYLYNSGAMIRVGGSVIEGSSTSSAGVDVVTVSGISIPPANPIVMIVQFGKNTSGGSLLTAGCGLKVNGTITSEAPNTHYANVGLGAMSSLTTAEIAMTQVWVGPRASSYQRTAFGHIITSAPTGAGLVCQPIFCCESSNWPLATTTAIAIRGKTQNASATIYVTSVHIYMLPATSL